VDCRRIFGDRNEIPSSELTRQLNADPEAPWADYGVHGLTQAKLARLLSEFDIKSGNVRFPDGTQSKGYRRSDFQDAWNRYCPDDTASHPSQASRPAHRGTTRPRGTDHHVPPNRNVPA
jgi:hypothetical protein